MFKNNLLLTNVLSTVTAEDIRNAFGSIESILSAVVKLWRDGNSKTKGFKISRVSGNYLRTTRLPSNSCKRERKELISKEKHIMIDI